MDMNAEIFAELKRADAARSAGNEGRARVCARRAAGIAAREFLLRHEIQTSDVAQGRSHIGSSYDALKKLADVPGLGPEIKRAVGYLTLRVNEDFSLPVTIDLIEEARKIIEGLA